MRDLLSYRVGVGYILPLFIASGDPHQDIVAIWFLNAHCVIIVFHNGYHQPRAHRRFYAQLYSRCV